MDAKPRALVVDDESQIANSIARVLANDFAVVTVEDGRAALELLASDSGFAIILCDMSMPRMSGMELHEALKQLGNGLEKRMLFTTGGAVTARAKEFLAKNSGRYLEKPFDANSLRAAVTSFMASLA